MQQVADWLKKLGMSEYAERFAENDVDMAVLPDLTDQHLKDLGVSLGHRLKMLRAIRDLSGAPVAVTPPSAPLATQPTQRNEAERRQLTVMFCDLVGSTALSAKLDPEDLRGIVSAYHRCCTDVIEHSGGFVAKYMGDGVLAYFGYPQAHEHDAERAVRAGLAVVETVPKLDTGAGVPLQVRIGIATGLVVVGDLIGTGAAQEQAVVGETPNLAARLQALAEPGTVVIAASTRRLTSGLFEYRDLGTVSAKGFGDPVQVWQVTGASAVESRFEALRTTSTPLIGRDEEINLLQRRWDKAKCGEGCVVLISGEAGIGKSRIAQTILERLSNEPHTRLRYFCSPHHQHSAFHPSIAQLERAAGFRRDDNDEQRLDKLEAILRQGTEDLSEVVPLLADLLSIPTGNRYPPHNLTPQQCKEKTLLAQLAQVEGLAARQPVLLVFEDVHWSDPTTRESLDLLIDRVSGLRVMAIITFRPEFAPSWVGRRQVTMLHLDRLSHPQRSEMITRVTGGKLLPKEIIDQIVDRTDGVPLFIEELTKAIVESGIVSETSDGYTVTSPLAALTIPTTLHASLLARLDRLAPTREVAQIAAALGRRFSHELISAVASMPQHRVDDALAQLVSAELILRRGTPPDAEYSFKHALVQDAAYSTLLRSRRQELHARIANILEHQFPDIVVSQPEIAARHCTEGALSEAAIEWWGKAGELALRRSAYVEAVAHYGKAISLAEGLAAVPALLRLRMQIAYGQALINARGYGMSETTAAFARARELAGGIEDATERFPAYYGLWAGSYVRGELASMRELAEVFLREAKCRPGAPELSVAQRAFGTTCWFQGDLVNARAHHEQALAAYDADRDRSLAFRFGQDPGVSAMLNLAWALWPLGDLVRACRVAKDGLIAATSSGHIPTVVYGQAQKCLFEAMRRDVDRARQHADAVVGLSREHRLPLWIGIGSFLQGWARWKAGDRVDGTTSMSEGMALCREQRFSPWMPFFEALQAEAKAAEGQVEAGLSDLDVAFGEVSQTGQRWVEPELHRVRGEILLRREPLDLVAAESAFGLAIENARKQHSRTFELHAATCLARLWRNQGNCPRGRDLLAPIYGWFTEGFDTPILKEAKALLDELA
jgi:class 3 adenylate cyclase/predicted ATPase